jgi:hypothetical protein
MKKTIVSQLEQAKSLKELMDNLEDLASKKFATEYRKLENFLLNLTSGSDKYVYTGTPPDFRNKKFVILELKTEDSRKKRIASTMMMLYAYSMINKLPRQRKVQSGEGILQFSHVRYRTIYSTLLKVLDISETRRLP